MQAVHGWSAAAAKVPAGQSSHATLPAAVVWRPGVQSVHVLSPAPRERPAAHRVQSRSPLAAHWPSPQAKQPAAAAPLTRPAAQMSHAVCAVAAAKVPPEHSSHVELPAVTAKRPTAHVPQPLLPRTLARPAGHSEHSAAPSAEKVPAMHHRQMLLSPLGENLPAAQGTHTP